MMIHPNHTLSTSIIDFCGIMVLDSPTTAAEAFVVTAKNKHIHTYVNPNSHNNHRQCRTTSNGTYLPWKKIPLLLLFLFLLFLLFFLLLLFTFLRYRIQNMTFLTFSTDWQLTCHTGSKVTFSAGPVTNLPNNKHTAALITLRADSVANNSINVHVIWQFARLALLSCGIIVGITGAILIAVN